MNSTYVHSTGGEEIQRQKRNISGSWLQLSLRKTCFDWFNFEPVFVSANKQTKPKSFSLKKFVEKFFVIRTEMSEMSSERLIYRRWNVDDVESARKLFHCPEVYTRIGFNEPPMKTDEGRKVNFTSLKGFPSAKWLCQDLSEEPFAKSDKNCLKQGTLTLILKGQVLVPLTSSSLLVRTRLFGKWKKYSKHFLKQLIPNK